MENNIKFCTNCGKQIPADAKFCSVCGAAQVSVEAEAAPAKATEEMTPKAEKKSLLDALHIPMGAVAPIIVAFLSFIMLNPHPIVPVKIATKPKILIIYSLYNTISIFFSK